MLLSIAEESLDPVARVTSLSIVFERYISLHPLWKTLSKAFEKSERMTAGNAITSVSAHTRAFRITDQSFA